MLESWGCGLYTSFYGKYLSLCTCNYPFYSAYKSLNHLVNFEQVKLSSDIEKNPGPPVFVDATKTIHVPYCQGNVVVFGGNAGQQCVAMSLCALIYSKIRMITSVDDMIQIMTVGNELYSSLSLLARQSMLMFTELPVMVTVFERFFDFLIFFFCVDWNILYKLCSSANNESKGFIFSCRI